MPLRDFYVADGTHNTVLRSDELLLRIRVPINPRRREGFAKLRHRRSIDFPLLSVGLAFVVDDKRHVVDGMLAVNALAARPKQISLAAIGNGTLDADFVAAAADLAHHRCSPLTNLGDDPSWRKDMIAVLVSRAFAMTETDPAART